MSLPERSVAQLLKTSPPDHSEFIENPSYIEIIKRKQMLKVLFDTHTPNFQSIYIFFFSCNYIIFDFFH
jgi:hypothetical protein